MSLDAPVAQRRLQPYWKFCVADVALEILKHTPSNDHPPHRRESGSAYLVVSEAMF